MELEIFLCIAACAMAIWLAFPVLLSYFLTGNPFWTWFVFIALSSLVVFVLAMTTTYWVLANTGVVDSTALGALRISRQTRAYHSMIERRVRNNNQHQHTNHHHHNNANTNNSNTNNHSLQSNPSNNDNDNNHNNKHASVGGITAAFGRLERPVTAGLLERQNSRE